MFDDNLLGGDAIFELSDGALLAGGNPAGWDAARGGWVLDEARDRQRIGLRPPLVPPPDSRRPANGTANPAPSPGRRPRRRK